MFSEMLSRLYSSGSKSVGQTSKFAPPVLSQEYLALYKSIHETCAPGVEASVAKVRRKYFLFQHLKHLRNRSVATTAEFGVFRGQSSLMMMTILNRQGDRHHIFDSFEGLSETTQHDKLSSSKFGDMSPDMDHIRQLMPKAVLHRGWIPAELPDLDERIDFAHVDLDLHEPVSGALSWVHQRRAPGATIIVDDYCSKWPGCVRAVDDFVTEKAEDILFAMDTTYSNFIIVMR
jgi:Macrocin-O-methyltransferase (TylF)